MTWICSFWRSQHPISNVLGGGRSPHHQLSGYTQLGVSQFNSVLTLYPQVGWGCTNQGFSSTGPGPSPTPLPTAVGSPGSYLCFWRTSYKAEAPTTPSFLGFNSLVRAAHRTQRNGLLTVTDTSQEQPDRRDAEHGRRKQRRLPCPLQGCYSPRLSTCSPTQKALWTPSFLYRNFTTLIGRTKIQASSHSLNPQTLSLPGRFRGGTDNSDPRVTWFLLLATSPHL